MKNVLILSVCMLCAAVNLQAQQKINVQNGAKTEFYNDLEAAVQAAVSGDTIYLPGATIELQDHLTIDKKLALIGAGWDMDSIGGLKTTEIRIKNGGHANINFSEGADGSLLTGFLLNEIIFANDASQSIANVTIVRIRTYNGIHLGAGVNHIFIRESYFNGFDGREATDCWINNNLIHGGFGNIKDSHIYNNVMFAHAQGTACVFENNWISDSPGGISNTYNHNAFREYYTFPFGENNNGSNNLMNQLQNETFEVNSGNLPKYQKIKETSPCKNAGADGTDIGMYGGSDPYKDGAVPFHPHVDKIVVSSQTDKAGNLKVEIQVSAQTK
jgi:hypothetical protein